MKTALDIPQFLGRPPLRCYEFRGRGALEFCGRPAVAYRPGGAFGIERFLCARHAAAGDLPLPATVLFRRVRLVARVDLAGVSWSEASAHVEAVDCVSRAVADAGGLLDILQATSVVGQHTTGPTVGAVSASVRRG